MSAEQVKYIEAVKKVLVNSKMGIFAEREDTTQALEYNNKLNEFGSTKASRTVGIGVYHNTLLKNLIEGLDKDLEELKNRGNDSEEHF